ncbi:arginine--tRNA ligase [Flavihumibacter petaseus]|uniref:Arginine--tRNA ligase n=1 Tax=Flavihumibacter petaseus NBRC 106054 TaxID=1220578 RepID=A0A0E9N7Q1_9BACT|nr:arginine--tRNA ligase [Flavihumibacter petaseus]GAO45370.1 arginyl-tRNA synthetase [Flavihumibacter petaseus NBRC 106054]
MSIAVQIQSLAATAIAASYPDAPAGLPLQISRTKPEFEGDYTLVLFPFVKALKSSPDAIGQALGDYLVDNSGGLIDRYNIIKGFLNLVVADKYWTHFLNEQAGNPAFGVAPSNGHKVMVEYSSPNTNKPLHLGHLRNNFLGWSIASILQANGNEVVKSCIVNDRGIHICKSMIAWQRFGNGATPASTGMKGDHFVGLYYVKFNDALKAEVEAQVAAGKTKEVAEKEAPILQEAQQMLVDWEAGKPDVIELWKAMNGWVYEGFDETYARIGSNFDIVYYESNTYLLGKKTVQEGLAKGVFYQKEDGSVWIDLTGDGLDEKLVQRKDGTSVYMTQDIGLAQEKYNHFHIDQSIYVVGDEQNYHFKVLQLIAQKLGLPNAEGIHHLSYGMVELPTGKMKSREGTVVDADDLVQEMVTIAESHTKELGKVEGFTEAELKDLYDIIGLGALKFYLLRVDPKKKMIFNPEESIDIHGYTGPFIQYTHARTKSILRKDEVFQQYVSGEGLYGYLKANHHKFPTALLPLEKTLLVNLEEYPSIIDQAALEYNPSLLANYCYNLAKTFNSFLTQHNIHRAESEEKKQLRLRIAVMTAGVLKAGMALLGIRVPEKM